MTKHDNPLITNLLATPEVIAVSEGFYDPSKDKEYFYFIDKRDVDLLYRLHRGIARTSGAWYKDVLISEVISARQSFVSALLALDAAFPASKCDVYTKELPALELFRGASEHPEGCIGQLGGLEFYPA